MPSDLLVSRIYHAAHMERDHALEARCRLRFRGSGCRYRARSVRGRPRASDAGPHGTARNESARSATRAPRIAPGRPTSPGRRCSPGRRGRARRRFQPQRRLLSKLSHLGLRDQPRAATFADAAAANRNRVRSRTQPPLGAQAGDRAILHLRQKLLAPAHANSRGQRSLGPRTGRNARERNPPDPPGAGVPVRIHL